MTEREAFLDSLATAAKRPRHQLKDHPFKPLNDLPDTTLATLNDDDLFALAKTSSEAVHVDFQTTTKATLPQALDAFLTAKEAKTPLLPTSERFSEYGLESWRDQLTPTPSFWVPGAGREANIDTASHADAAIGFADYLLAESGTITVATTPGQGRAFHFLPTHYLAVIKKSDILSRSRQAMYRYEKAFADGSLTTSNINFITGPSNSGDIEMVLIVGVHGPLDMTYLVVTDM